MPLLNRSKDVTSKDGGDSTNLNGVIPEEDLTAAGPSGASSKKASNKDIAKNALSDLKKIEDIKKAIDLLRLTGQVPGAQPPAQPKNAEEAKKKRYEFWETQPVPKLSEDESVLALEVVNEPIDPNTDIEKVRKEPLPLPDGFVWVSLDIENEGDVSFNFILYFGKIVVLR